jgi:hypothetical protein
LTISDLSRFSLSPVSAIWIKLIHSLETASRWSDARWVARRAPSFGIFLSSSRTILAAKALQQLPMCGDQSFARRPRGFARIIRVQKKIAALTRLSRLQSWSVCVQDDTPFYCAEARKCRLENLAEDICKNLSWTGWPSEKNVEKVDAYLPSR